VLTSTQTRSTADMRYKCFHFEVQLKCSLMAGAQPPSQPVLLPANRRSNLPRRKLCTKRLSYRTLTELRMLHYHITQTHNIYIYCTHNIYIYISIYIVYSPANKSISVTINILFDGENISFDVSLVIYIYIYSTSIPPIIIMK
jgi:hypothetical protein